jgi:hypothetical protein
MATPFCGLDKYFIGNDVQFLLCFALHVLTARTSEYTNQLALVDIMRYLFTGHDDVADQPGEIASGGRDGALFFDNELDQTLAHAFTSFVLKNLQLNILPLFRIALYGYLASFKLRAKKSG